MPKGMNATSAEKRLVRKQSFPLGFKGIILSGLRLSIHVSVGLVVTLFSSPGRMSGELLSYPRRRRGRGRGRARARAQKL